MISQRLYYKILHAPDKISFKGNINQINFIELQFRKARNSDIILSDQFS